MAILLVNFLEKGFQMKKIITLGMLSTMTIFALGGFNETKVDDVTVENTNTATQEATQRGTASSGASIQNNAGLLNIQQSTSIKSTIDIKHVDVINTGEAKSTAENTADASGVGVIQNSAGMMNIQVVGAGGSDTTITNTDVLNSGTSTSTAINTGQANSASVQNAAGLLNIQN